VCCLFPFAHRVEGIALVQLCSDLFVRIALNDVDLLGEAVTVSVVGEDFIVLFQRRLEETILPLTPGNVISFPPVDFDITGPNYRDHGYLGSPECSLENSS